MTFDDIIWHNLTTGQWILPGIFVFCNWLFYLYSQSRNTSWILAKFMYLNKSIPIKARNERTNPKNHPPWTSKSRIFEKKLFLINENKHWSFSRITLWPFYSGPQSQLKVAKSIFLSQGKGNVNHDKMNCLFSSPRIKYGLQNFVKSSCPFYGANYNFFLYSKSLSVGVLMVVPFQKCTYFLVELYTHHQHSAQIDGWDLKQSRARRAYNSNAIILHRVYNWTHL